MAQLWAVPAQVGGWQCKLVRGCQATLSWEVMQGSKRKGLAVARWEGALRRDIGEAAAWSEVSLG